jgi:CHASE1-domain containing sensor protein
MNKSERSRLARFGPWLPGGTFLAGLLVTAWLVFVIYGDRSEHEERHFDDAVQENLRLADQRIAAVGQLLRAGVSVAAGERMSPEAWTRFIRTLRVEEDFP